jgi:hypothetical protein
MFYGKPFLDPGNITGYVFYGKSKRGSTMLERGNAPAKCVHTSIALDPKMDPSFPSR